MWKVVLLLGCASSLVITAASDDTSESESSSVQETSYSEESSSSQTIENNDGAFCAPRCRKNEVYTNLKNQGCTPSWCSELGFPMQCDDRQPGCVCKDSYLRSNNGTCIPQDMCPSCGGDPNAQSGCGSNCGKTCATYKNKQTFCAFSCILNGCDCREGFVYDPYVKKCVAPEQCTPTCGTNEMFSNCTNGGCDARNCTQLGTPVPCVKLDPKYCIKGCICQTGLLRASNGTCVPKNQCDGGCGGDPNAISGCGVNCGRTCSTYKKKPVVCPLICKLDGCDCKNNFVYDPAVKRCVLPIDCTPTCGTNEMFSNCTNGGCDARNCTQLGTPVPCVKLDPKYCIKGCICQTGLLRASNGTCVPKNQCDGGCGGDPNAISGCGVNCGRTCSTYKKKPVVCPLICKLDGCDCKNNFVYDPAVKRCVLPIDCTPTCGVNEIASNCSNGGCGPFTCSDLGSPIKCVRPIECLKGCVCQNQYVRNENGTCVPKDQCTGPCGGDPNAKPGCGVNCGKTCSTYKSKSPICPRICKVNGCDCKDNFVYDPNIEKCVPPEKCTTSCGLNEVYSSCTNGGCDARNCSQLGKPVPCVKLDPKYCIKGCICQKDYLRASNGTCVPNDQCQPVNCGLNEVFDVCPAPCPPRRCDVDDSVIRCKAPPEPNSPECKPGCRCADNYARNSKGICVLRSQCDTPRVCGPNEVYDTCPVTCPPQKCGIDPALILCAPSPSPGDDTCRPACKCTDGYVRNDSDVCIPKDECPKCSGQNEYFETCIQGCSNQTCNDIGKTYNCPLQTTVCKTGCRCNPGFWRNSMNDCVPESECPKCSGQNEYFETCIQGCSNQTCNDIGKRYNCPLQPAVCKTGCRCSPGFWRNSVNDCVPESECPTPSCPDGETYSRCPTVKCDGDYCPKTRNSPLTCPVGIVCDPPRCVCGFNRHRDRSSGKCVATADCPPFPCNGPNEKYDSCPPVCPGENCTDYINDIKCPRFRIGIVVPCKPQCKCELGYYRNSNGVCIIGYECGPKNTTISTSPTPALINDTDSDGANLTSLQAGIIDFSGKFLYDRITASPGENIIISAFSVFPPLAKLALYTNGESLIQLLTVLNQKSKGTIRSTFPILRSTYEGQKSVEFATADKIYANENYKLSDDFKKTTVEVFNSESQNLDFGNPDQAAGIINTWVENKTNNRIHDLVSPDMFDAATCIVLVNAIYFKGDWLSPFDKNNTKEANFYLTDGTTKKTKLMYQKGNFKYGEVNELNCTLLELPYRGKNFTMFIALPYKNDGLMDLAKNFQVPSNYYKAYESLRNEEVKVYLPQFEIKTTTDLADMLQKQNVTKIFSTNDSGINGILAKPQNMFVSKAIQKAWVKVDEKGSEATAANAAVVGVTAVFRPVPKDIIFRADHSFLYYILFNGTITFCGSVVNLN